jgi:hypothetical protein
MPDAFIGGKCRRESDESKNFPPAREPAGALCRIVKNAAGNLLASPQQTIEPLQLWLALFRRDPFQAKPLTIHPAVV